MSHWNTRGLRGSAFEESINLTNERYRKEGLAMIQKIPTPIKPLEIDQERRVISLAYFEQKSTVDYIGVMAGMAICFDAKECTKKSLPFSNIHPHQVEFMKDFVRQGGIAFLLVHFTAYQETYVLPLETLVAHYEGKTGRSSIPYDAFDKELLIPDDGSPYIHYLRVVLKYMKQETKRQPERREDDPDANGNNKEE